jgi:membrane protease YdiL (CAAX protease family)
MRFRDGGTAAPLGYAIGCALFVGGCALAFRENMGTHRLPIHITSVVLAAAYCAAAKVRERGDVLPLVGLRRPRSSRWIWALLALGALSGALRYELFRRTGLGGAKLYQRDFVPVLNGDSTGEVVIRCCLLLIGSYVAVLVPAILFFGVIQERFSRAGWFLAGLLVQSAVFGVVHSYMTGSFDPIYGGEAFVGAVASGVVYEQVKNVYVPALLMSSSVAVSTFLLAFSG